MRKLTVFIASFVVVLVAGAAMAQFGSYPSGEEKDTAEQTTTTTTDRAPSRDGVDETPGPKVHPDDVAAKDGAVDDGRSDDEPVEPTRGDVVLAEEPDGKKDATEGKDEAEEPEDLWIEVLYPASGQGFEEKTLVFEGEVTPGTRVFAGKYEADVDAEGNWRIVLVLSPGWNRATFTAVAADGRETTDSVKVFYDAPARKPKPPAREEPKEESPAEWKFAANQTYGECAENPPYDVFWGEGKPGSTITVVSEFGSGSTKVDADGEWELKVTFPDAPYDRTFLVQVKDQFGNVAKFEFTRVKEA